MKDSKKPHKFELVKKDEDEPPVSLLDILQADYFQKRCKELRFDPIYEAIRLYRLIPFDSPIDAIKIKAALLAKFFDKAYLDPDRLDAAKIIQVSDSLKDKSATELNQLLNNNEEQKGFGKQERIN